MKKKKKESSKHYFNVPLMNKLIYYSFKGFIISSSLQTRYDSSLMAILLSTEQADISLILTREEL